MYILCTQQYYVFNKSNHPPNIIKNIPESINRRLSNISSNETIFKKAIPPYQDALKKSGYNYKLEYKPTPTDNSPTDILWFQNTYKLYYLSPYLSPYLFICLSVYLHISISIYLHIYLSVCLSACLPACLHVRPSIHPSISLSICLSIYLKLLSFSFIQIKLRRLSKSDKLDFQVEAVDRGGLSCKNTVEITLEDVNIPHRIVNLPRVLELRANSPSTRAGETVRTDWHAIITSTKDFFFV